VRSSQIGALDLDLLVYLDLISTKARTSPAPSTRRRRTGDAPSTRGQLASLCGAAHAVVSAHIAHAAALAA
jgi:hypothetical protein